jgi:hypothetical protein
MSHFEPYPNRNQVICPEEQLQMSRGLPVLKWLWGLFICNTSRPND